MAKLAARTLLLLALTLACGDKGKSGQAADPPIDDAASTVAKHVNVPDAMSRQPLREDALKVVQEFSVALLGSPPGEIGKSLRIPDGYTDQQLGNFYKELRRKHVSQQGIDAVLQKDFGPIVERLGEKAQSVADQVGLTLEETWAFGDVESAVVLHWDGQRFWVASVHQLLAPK